MNRVVRAIQSCIAVVTLICVNLPSPALAEAPKRYIVSPAPRVSSSGPSVAYAQLPVLDVMSDAGVTQAESLENINAAVVSLTEEQAADLSDEVARDGFIVEPDYPISIATVPNDPHYANYLGSMRAIGAEVAWSRHTGSSSIVVAVLDTGIDYNHPDLASNVWNNSAEIPSNGEDDDGNGTIDDIYGANFVDGTGDPYDDHYHGTHVAGTIGAVGNDGFGVAGVVWHTKLMALKVLGSSGSGYTSGIIQAVGYAVMMKQRGVNIRVINASLGGGAYSSAFQSAINQAYNEGILFVAAAGNSSADNDVSMRYPANYENVIAVAAVNNSGALASFSNYGANRVALAAPGVSVFSTLPLRFNASNPAWAYAFLSGTSMAAPHVTGAVALVLSKVPTLTPAEVRTKILESVTPIGGLTGKVRTAGMLNIQNLMDGVSGQLGGVVLKDGVGLPGVTISDLTLGSVTTDSEGRFNFSNARFGVNYSLQASKFGYTITGSATSGIISTETTVSFNAVPQLFDIRGVIKKAGAPLPGVTVVAPGLGKKVTGLDGSFNFGRLPFDAAYAVVAVKRGFSIIATNAAGAIAGDTIIEFDALPQQIEVNTITLTVKSTENKPLSRVKVVGDFGELLTDRKGMLTIKEIENGKIFSIKLSRKGWKLSPSVINGVLNKDLSVKVRARNLKN